MIIKLHVSLNLFCRKVPDRPRDPAKWNEIADVVSALSIPVIANDDAFEYDDFARIKTATGSWKYFIMIFKLCFACVVGHCTFSTKQFWMEFISIIYVSN